MLLETRKEKNLIFSQWLSIHLCNLTVQIHISLEQSVAHLSQHAQAYMTQYCSIFRPLHRYLNDAAIYTVVFSAYAPQPPPPPKKNSPITSMPRYIGCYCNPFLSPSSARCMPSITQHNYFCMIAEWFPNVALSCTLFFFCMQNIFGCGTYHSIVMAGRSTALNRSPFFFGLNACYLVPTACLEPVTWRDRVALHLDTRGFPRLLLFSQIVLATSGF